MEISRYQIKDSLEVRVQCFAASLFDQHGQRVALIEEAEFALWVLPGARIEENAALDQDAVHIADHTADIAQAVVLIGTVVNVVAHFEVELGVVALVHRVGLAVLRNAHIAMAKAKLADARVKCEAVDPAPGGVNEHGGGAIEDIPGGHLLGA